MSFVSQFDALHEQAIGASGGLSDFGTTDYVEPMQRLLVDFDKYCRFSPLGQQAAAMGLVGCLVGRLHAFAGFKTHPSYAGGSIEKPLFIVGTMRTGTTALLTLLAQDPDNQGLEYWLARTPMPRPPRETWESNAWFQMGRQGLEQFYALAPMKDVHPMYADQPDECLWVLDQTMWSVSQTMHATVPDYAEWCLAADARDAYRYYRRVLGLIAGGDPRRWALKTPVHLWGLDALLDVFPDACIIFTHRDITTSMTSTASLAYAIHHPLEPELTKAQIGKPLVKQWGKALDKAEKVRRQHDPARFIDIHSRQLQADPIGTVERIYRYFDLPFTERYREALEQQVRSDPRAGHGAHRYHAEDFGLTQEEVVASVGEYYERLIGVEACQT